MGAELSQQSSEGQRQVSAARVSTVTYEKHRSEPEPEAERMVWTERQGGVTLEFIRPRFIYVMKLFTFRHRQAGSGGSSLSFKITDMSFFRVNLSGW